MNIKITKTTNFLVKNEENNWTLNKDDNAYKLIAVVHFPDTTPKVTRFESKTYNKESEYADEARAEIEWLICTFRDKSKSKTNINFVYDN